MNSETAGEPSGKVEIWAQFYFKQENLEINKYLILALVFFILVSSVALLGSFFDYRNMPEIAKMVLAAILDAFTRNFFG